MLSFSRVANIIDGSIALLPRDAVPQHCSRLNARPDLISTILAGGGSRPGAFISLGHAASAKTTTSSTRNLITSFVCNPEWLPREGVPSIHMLAWSRTVLVARSGRSAAQPPNFKITASHLSYGVQRTAASRTLVTLIAFSGSGLRGCRDVLARAVQADSYFCKSQALEACKM